MRLARRLASLILAGAALTFSAASPADPAPQDNGIQFKVLVFTKAAAGGHASTNAGVTALRALGNDYRFTIEVTDDARKFDVPHLKQFRAVVFLNTTGDVLNATQQAAFEAYFHDGGSFVGIHSAIEAEPGNQFFTDLLGTRSSNETEVQSGTIKVADRGHDASKDLPEYWTRTDAWYNFTSNVRGTSHVLATVVEDPFSAQPSGLTLDGIAGGTMGADHPVAWCKDWKGGRSFYTSRRPYTLVVRRTCLPRPSRRRGPMGGRRLRSCLQRLRRHRPRQLPADKNQRAAEPQRADRLRRPPGREGDPDGPWRRGPAA